MAGFADAGQFWARLSTPEKVAVGVLGIGVVFLIVYKLRSSNANQPITFAAAPTPAGSGIPQDTSGGGVSSGGTATDYSSAISAAVSQQAANDQALIQANQSNYDTLIAGYQNQVNTLASQNQALAQQLAVPNEGTNTPAATQQGAQSGLALQPPNISIYLPPSQNTQPAHVAATANHPRATTGQSKHSEVLTVHNAANAAHEQVKNTSNGATHTSGREGVKQIRTPSAPKPVNTGRGTGGGRTQVVRV